MTFKIHLILNINCFYLIGLTGGKNIKLRIMNILRIASFIILGVIMYSCGNDSVTTPTTPSGTVLFSEDSLSVRLQPGSASGGDTVYVSMESTGGLKIEFNLESNADSTHAIGYYGVYTNATPTFTYDPLVYRTTDEYFTTNLNFANGTTYFSFAVRLYVTNSTMLHYIKLKNVKVTKL